MTFYQRELPGGNLQFKKKIATKLTRKDLQGRPFY